MHASSRPNRARAIVYFIGITAALAGLLFGLDTGVISGAQLFIQREFSIGDQMIEYIVSALLWGAVFGSLLSGFLSERFGRRRTLLASAAIFVIGALLCASSPSPDFLIAARFLLGVGVGVASFVAPIYLAEVAPQSVRGGMISMYQLMITIGILAAFLSDAFFSNLASADVPIAAATSGDVDARYLESFVLSVTHGSGAWRLMFGVLVIPAIIMFAGVWFLPESPRWLLLNGSREGAERVFKRLHLDDTEISAQAHAIEESVKIPQRGARLFRENRNFRRAVFLGVGLQVIQQFTGINVILYYAPRIFGMAGFESTAEQMWGTVAIGLTNVLATFIAIAFVDRVGRKPILYAGFLAMGAALIGVGALFHMDVEHNASLGYGALLGIMVFIVGFAMSAGPIIWVLCSEIYPLAGRDFGITCSTGTNWIANALIGMTFLTLVIGVGPGNAFLLFGAFIVFTFVLVPETKGVSLERIETDLLAGRPLRTIGRT